MVATWLLNSGKMADNGPKSCASAATLRGVEELNSLNLFWEKLQSISDPELCCVCGTNHDYKNHPSTAYTENQSGNVASVTLFTTLPPSEGSLGGHESTGHHNGGQEEAGGGKKQHFFFFFLGQQSAVAASKCIVAGHNSTDRPLNFTQNEQNRIKS